MTIMAELLLKAYKYIAAGNVQYARAILESLINTDPLNIEAWEACMQISETCEELDYLCKQVLQIPELNPTDRESILDYYYFLRQTLRTDSVKAGAPKMITYELVNQFTFRLKDQQSNNSNDAISIEGFEQGLTWLLDKAIILLHIILLVTGLKLINLGNTFGYWIIMVVFISIFVSLWNIILPFPETDKFPDSSHSDTTDGLDDVFPIV
jgi:hypothetical protein